ncbi:MAG: response regulator [Chloroflexi bacterium]|nr:response regulator [Chloroflexota bacterium]
MVSGSTDSSGISASNGGMILIVEDDDRISRLERFVLEQVGYRVTCAGTGEEALDILPKATPSLVLLDVMLPQMDGFTTCQKIRESSQVPIIMVTARDRDADKVRGLEMGADDYITKPFSTHELASRVKSVLRRTDGNRDHNTPAFQPPSKRDMSFLHPRDEELGYPTQPPVSESGGLLDHYFGNGKSTSIVVQAASGAGKAANENYEGAVRLIVRTTGAVKELIRFVDSLREDPQIHLLRMVSNPRRDGMEVWLRLRAPNPLRTTLLAAAGVSRVEAADRSESEPDTAVLKVSLD